jgi:hypothetical protein
MDMMAKHYRLEHVFGSVLNFMLTNEHYDAGALYEDFIEEEVYLEGYLIEEDN